MNNSFFISIEIREWSLEINQRDKILQIAICSYCWPRLLKGRGLRVSYLCLQRSLKHNQRLYSS